MQFMKDTATTWLYVLSQEWCAFSDQEDKINVHNILNNAVIYFHRTKTNIVKLHSFILEGVITLGFIFCGSFACYACCLMYGGIVAEVPRMRPWRIG